MSPEPPLDSDATSLGERLSVLVEVVQAFAAGDYSRPAVVGPAGDEADALAAGINMLVEEVEWARAELEKVVVASTARAEELAKLSSQLESEISERREREERLREAHQQLAERLADVERLNREISKLTEMTNLFQVCGTREEAFAVLGQVAPDLFDGTSGVLYVFVPSRDVLDIVIGWGEIDPPRVIEPADCWGLRRSRLHASLSNAGLRCGHIAADWAGDHLCMPLIAQGVALGLLHLRYPTVGDSDTENGSASAGYERFAGAAAEQIALALANLELRTALQAQSIRDPLTNLYNRRYLDETLVRELHRTSRDGSPVSFLMIDVDRFKTFNDTYGHDAGDVALRELAVILRENVRGDDVVCRFGGEELAIVMAGVDTDEALRRAEHLRTAIRDAEFDWHGQPLGTITASFGVATAPTHANTKDGLIKAADSALYQAKAQGRDRVALFEPNDEA
jgi:diguanylate cyclase (GGDEF)-like protein